MGKLYDTDIVAWASEQAALIRGRQWHSLDIEHIAEEIECVGKQERRELESRIAVLIGHLLKWKFQPGRRCTNWENIIDAQRTFVENCLDEAPSLRHCLADKAWQQRVWNHGYVAATGETGLHDLPRQAMWSADQLRDPEFFPN